MQEVFMKLFSLFSHPTSISFLTSSLNTQSSWSSISGTLNSQKNYLKITLSPQSTTSTFFWITWDSLLTMSNTKKTQRIPRRPMKILSESYAMDWEEPLRIPPKSTRVWKKLSKSIWETTSSAFTRSRPHKKESRKQSYRLIKEFNPLKGHMKRSETYNSCIRKMIYLNVYMNEFIFKIISQIICI